MKRIAGVALVMGLAAGASFVAADKPETKTVCVEVVVPPQVDPANFDDLEFGDRPMAVSGDPTFNGPGSRGGATGCGASSCSLMCNGNTCQAGPCIAGFYAYCDCTVAGGCIGSCYKCGK